MTSTSSVAGTLAARAATAADAPVEVTSRALWVIADVLAAAASGATFTDVADLRTMLAVGGGPSTVIGRQAGAAPTMAALVNAVPIAREQLQDGHRRARGHPGSHVVPAVLAVAEPVAASGQRITAAVLAGYEVGARLGVAMDGTPPGVHDIATWGTVGAAAGVAHLMANGDPEVIAAAIELAATMAVVPDARTVFDGASGQHLFLGVGAQLGVLHGQAAAAGLRAPTGNVERHFARWLAADPDRVRGLAAGIGDADWLIRSGYLKRHPTCGLLHGVNDAVEDIVAEHGALDPGRIVAVVVHTYSAAAAFDNPDPHNDLAARFSIPWTVAAGLARGGLGPGSFTPDALQSHELMALARRVTVRHVPSLDAGYPAGRPSAVSVRLADGSTLQAEADLPRGDGPGALDDSDVRGKPLRLLGGVGGARWTDLLVEAVGSMETDGAAALFGRLRQPLPVVPLTGTAEAAGTLGR